MSLPGSACGLAAQTERRQCPRQRINSLIYVRAGAENGGILLDLSENGMCISVANPVTVSSEIHFLLRLDEDRPIEGAGQVSWRSESGRSAGVRFSSFPNESRMRIRQWLAGTGGLTRETEPTAVAAAVPPNADRGDAAAAHNSAAALSERAGARPEAETRTEVLRASEAGERHSAPETPLFFLPKRPVAAEIYDELTSQPETYRWHAEKEGKESEGGTVMAFRAAITSNPEPGEKTSPEERRFKRTVLALTICLVLAAMGIAAIGSYPNRFSELRQFTASLVAPPAVTTTAPAETPRPARRIRRRVARRMFASGPQRGSRPVRDSAIFDAPRDNDTPLAMTATDSSHQLWLASASGRRLVPNDAPSAMPAASSASASLPGAAATANPPASAPTTAAALQSTTQMGSLRVDGGFLEEGSVSPTFAPLNLDGQTLDAKPIVVEAVIGKDGGVENVRLVSSPASKLAQAVVSAVKLWRYRPFYRDGQPIEFVTRITFDFSLPSGNLY